MPAPNIMDLFQANGPQKYLDSISKWELEQQMNKQAADYFGQFKPENMPEYQSTVGEDGNLKAGFSLSDRGPVNFNYNRRALDALTSRGMATGDSPWAQLMLQKQGIEQGAKGDEYGRRQNAANASAWSGMATRGGIRSGAKERLATKGARETMLGRNQIGREGELDRLGIRGTDETQKLDILKALPGAEMSVANAMYGADRDNRNYATDIEKTNLDSRLKDLGNRNQFAQEKWKNNMSTWAAERQAQATENAGKK